MKQVVIVAAEVDKVQYDKALKFAKSKDKLRIHLENSINREIILTAAALDRKRAKPKRKPVKA